MTKKKRRYPEWVVCLNCDHEYEKEELDSFYSFGGCPICDSKEYDTSKERGSFKLNESWDGWR